MILRVPSLFAALILLIGTVTIAAQDSTDTVDCQRASKLKRSKNQPLVSLGVINGKAIKLVSPEFPPAARAVKVRGSVTVSVLIDPRGCVAEAESVSGHALLQRSAERAARLSAFHPFFPGAPRAWARGTIIYNYVSDTANWLEIGYFSTSPHKLLTYLPQDFENVRTDLRSFDSLPFEDREKRLAAVVEEIRLALNAEPKRLWLFHVGSQLGAISSGRWTGRDGLKKVIDNLRTFANTAPPDVEPALIKLLNQIIDESSSTTMWDRIRDLEERFYHLGN